MARTVGTALRPVDGNATGGSAQLAEAAHCAHAVQHAGEAQGGVVASRTPERERASSYVPAATQDEVAEQIATDHLKHLHLSPDGSAPPPSQESPAFTVPADSVRSPPRYASDPTAAVRIDEFLTMRVLYVPHCATGTGASVSDFQPCEQRLISAAAPGSAEDGCDVDASIPTACAQDVAADRVLIGLQLCNTHGSARYTVQIRVDGGPADRVVVAPGETVLSTAPRSGAGSPFESRVRPGARRAPLSPRSAAVPTEDSVSVTFTQPTPIGIVFDECEDARDGAKYLVVNSVHPGTQAAELRERTADASAAEGAALIRPGMVVQKISAGDDDTEVHVSSLYQMHGQVPPEIFAMRPLGLTLSARDHGIIEAELLERPNNETAAESVGAGAPPVVRVRIS